MAVVVDDGLVVVVLVLVEGTGVVVDVLPVVLVAVLVDVVVVDVSVVVLGEVDVVVEDVDVVVVTPALVDEVVVVGAAVDVVVDAPGDVLEVLVDVVVGQPPEGHASQQIGQPPGVPPIRAQAAAFRSTVHRVEPFGVTAQQVMAPDLPQTDRAAHLRASRRQPAGTVEPRSSSAFATHRR